MISWPPALPHCPLIDTFSEQFEHSVIRFQTEVGPGKARRRSTATNVPSQMTILFTVEQKVVFDQFFREDIASGARPFRMPYPAGGQLKTWRFNEPPAMTWNAPVWTVQLSLSRLD